MPAQDDSEQNDLQEMRTFSFTLYLPQDKLLKQQSRLLPFGPKYGPLIDMRND